MSGELWPEEDGRTNGLDVRRVNTKPVKWRIQQRGIRSCLITNNPSCNVSMSHISVVCVDPCGFLAHVSFSSLWPMKAISGWMRRGGWRNVWPEVASPIEPAPELSSYLPHTQNPFIWICTMMSHPLPISDSVWLGPIFIFAHFPSLHKTDQLTDYNSEH